MEAAGTGTSSPELSSLLEALLEGVDDEVAILATTAALVYDELDDLNWAGFYLLRNDRLVVGPYQGRPACIEIAIGRGVCGTAAARLETIVVPDVHAFDGHIACDARSRSELVVPVVVSGALVGVLDLDSPTPGRFDDDDARTVEALVATVAQLLARAGAAT
ncbi:MAG: GAF domain-containing protein [Thermoleophilia bacterium]|nr:GAF domain-containing protein [Thermoleophilia bacterium]